MIPDLVLEPKPEHGSYEWLLARHRDSEGRARLTASVAGAVVGEHEYLRPSDLALMMLKDEPPDTETTEAMARGQALEPALLDEWSRKMGYSVERPREMFVRGRILANLDGVCWEKDGPVEAKSTKHYFTEEKFGSEPFQSWRHQGIAQRWCFAGTPGWVYWVVLDGDLRFKYHEQFVEQDELDALVAACDEWMSYIDLGIPPVGIELDAKQVATLNPGATGTVELPEGAPYWVQLLVDSRIAQKEAKAYEDQAKNWLASHLAGHDIGLIDGREAVVWKEQAGRSSFDVRRLAEEMPDLYEKYLKRGEPFRTMRAKAEK